MGRKILFCDNSLRELLNFRGEVVRFYASQGAEVVLLAPPTSTYVPVHANVRYIPVKLSRSGMNPLSDFFYILALYRIYKKEKPDYVFHYTIKPNIYGTFVAHILGIPSSLMIAGLGYVFYKKGLGCNIARYLYKWALRYPQYVLVLNVANKDFLLSNKTVQPEKLIHLRGGEGVDLKLFSECVHPPVRNKMIFLMIARLLYDKGYAEYVDAARITKSKYPDTEFQILGAIDTVYLNHVTEEQVKHDHDCGYIRYLGFCPDVFSKIEAADCVVLPSYHEGLSRVLMEAIAMGKPVITSDIPGCRETVEEGVNGFLVPPKNGLALAEAIEKFVNLSFERRCKMGKCSRKKAEEEFDVKEVIDVYQKIARCPVKEL